MGWILAIICVAVLVLRIALSKTEKTTVKVVHESGYKETVVVPNTNKKALERLLRKEPERKHFVTKQRGHEPRSKITRQMYRQAHGVWERKVRRLQAG